MCVCVVGEKRLGKKRERLREKKNERSVRMRRETKEGNIGRN
jgi:hypothetical protein